MSDDIHGLVRRVCRRRPRRRRARRVRAAPGRLRRLPDRGRRASRPPPRSVAALGRDHPPASLRAALMRDIGAVRPLPPIVADEDRAWPQDPTQGSAPGPAPDAEPSRPAAEPSTDTPVPGSDELGARRSAGPGPAPRWRDGSPEPPRRPRSSSAASCGTRGTPGPRGRRCRPRSRSCGPVTPAATPTGRPPSCARPAWARPWSAGTCRRRRPARSTSCGCSSPTAPWPGPGSSPTSPGSGPAWCSRATPRRPPAPGSPSSRPAARTRRRAPRWRSSRSA